MFDRFRSAGDSHVPRERQVASDEREDEENNKKESLKIISQQVDKVRSSGK